MSGESSTLVEVLVATGLLTAVSESVRWFLTGRGRAKVDQAKIVQGMALDLLKPLHAELDEATTAAARLRRELADLDSEMQSVLGWAITARALLDSHGIPYPAPPEPVLTRRR